MTIVVSGTPYLVLSSSVSRKQAQKAVNQTTLRNLLTGGVEERTFHQSDNVDEAFIEKKDMVYIYTRNDEVWFHEVDNRSARFALPLPVVEHALTYITEGASVTARIFNPDNESDWHEHIVDIELPIKVELEVTEAPPNVRGDTVSGGKKRVTLETGLELDVPMFIETGETIRVNTQTGQYVERV